MHVSLATNPRDVNPMDRRFILQGVQSVFQVQIPAAEKIAVDLGRGSRSEGSDRPLGARPLDLVLREMRPLHRTREERFRDVPEVLGSFVAHAYHLAALLQV